MRRFEEWGHRVVPWAVAAAILALAYLGRLTG